jgi:hypothetical protein
MKFGDLTVEDYVDKNFVLHLATLGKVKLASHQVTVEAERLDFSKLTLPANCAIQWIGADAFNMGPSLGATVRITFKFSPQ